MVLGRGRLGVVQDPGSCNRSLQWIALVAGSRRVGLRVVLRGVLLTNAASRFALVELLFGLGLSIEMKVEFLASACFAGLRWMLDFF